MSNIVNAELDKEKKSQRRKDSIKNILIVFLVLMLLLTFFSGTIQNWSLPEVATASVQPGSISPQIRGTGTVSADDPYNITATESRKVASVAVKQGDKVKKGDVIYVLEDTDSTELTDAQNALDDLMEAYMTALFSGTITNDDISKIRNGQFGNADTYQELLRTATDNYNAAVETDKAVQGQINELESKYKKDQASIGGNTSSQTGTIDSATAEKEALSTERERAVTGIRDRQDKIAKLGPPPAADLDEFNALHPGLSDDPAVLSAEITSLSARVSEIDSKIVELNKRIAGAKGDIAKISRESGERKSMVDTDYNSKKAALEAHKAQTSALVEKRKAELEKVIAGIQAELKIEGQVADIDRAREKVAKLIENATGAQIVAPVDGTISAVNYVAGQTYNKSDTLAVIQVDGKPMSLNVTVTAEQAKNLKVGDTAEPQNSWYYTNFKCILKSIKPDPSDPGKNKVLNFTLESTEVQAGQTVNIKIGEAAKNFDMTVPNSAIREDNNGKFVLIVQTKTSPLRNRYIAQRVDVDVNASDDTTSAITAVIEGYEYVITTSTVPISAGQEVRLAETNY